MLCTSYPYLLDTGSTGSDIAHAVKLGFELFLCGITTWGWEFCAIIYHRQLGQSVAFVASLSQEGDRFRKAKLKLPKGTRFAVSCLRLWIANVAAWFVSERKAVLHIFLQVLLIIAQMFHWAELCWQRMVIHEWFVPLVVICEKFFHRYIMYACCPTCPKLRVSVPINVFKPLRAPWGRAKFIPLSVHLLFPRRPNCDCSNKM